MSDCDSRPKQGQTGSSSFVSLCGIFPQNRLAASGHIVLPQTSKVPLALLQTSCLTVHMLCDDFLATTYSSRLAASSTKDQLGVSVTGPWTGAIK